MVAHCVQLKIHPVKNNIFSIDLKNKGMYMYTASESRTFHTV